MKRLLFIALLAAAPAHAAFWDGNELLQRLNSDDAVRRAVALGYVMGVHDAFENVNHCPPANASAGQLRDIVRNYLTNVPAERHHIADQLVMRALEIAFPCSNRPRGGRQL